MDDLIKLVSQRVGISEDQARIAVITVVSFLKDRLPAPVGAQIDGLLNKPDSLTGFGGIPSKK